MEVEFIVNGETKVILVPKNQRDKALARLAFDGNNVERVDLREDGSLVFVLRPKQDA